MKREESEILTRVGPGTPLGEMMRCYWHPIAMSSQVEADSAPLRTRLLGERFVVFRDTDGRAGVLDEMCMHRGVSLALGRNEEGGLRCVYHGWKFAVDGTILETPNHADCRYRERMKAPAYPVREQSGLIWAYIGPADQVPPFREFEFDRLPAENRAVYRTNTKASWLPLWEGGLDSSHVGILHTNASKAKAKASNGTDTSAAQVNFLHNIGAKGDEPDSWDNICPEYEIEETAFGYHYCAFRDVPGKEGKIRNARLVPAIMPYMRIIPGKAEQNYAIEVPMDDFETATYIVAYNKRGPLDYNLWWQFLGLDNPYYDPVTCDMNLDWGNRMGQDRSTMDTSWTGIIGLEIEDFAMSASLGSDYDLAIVRMRRMVLDAVRKHQAGTPPPAVNVADMTSVCSYDLDIEVDAKWQELAPGNRVLADA
jgi:phthalate 4,5-dioxygenase